MGFGVSGSTAIIFLGVLVATGTLYPAVSGSAEQISDAHDGDREDLLDRRNTDLEVTRVVYNNSSDNLEVSVKNTGATTLSVDGTSLLVDNVHEPPAATRVDGDGSTDVGGAEQTLVMDVSGIADRPNRVKVVAENGVAASNSTVEEI